MEITYLITGRGARIRHIHCAGGMLCPTSASREATGRFEKLPVCARCEENLTKMEEKQAARAAEPVVASGEVVVHLSARVAAFMATEVVDAALAGALASPRLERCGRGYTAFVTTSRERAEALLGQMKELLFALESGARTKGRKGGMNFQPEAVIKGIEHITADLTTD